MCLWFNVVRRLSTLPHPRPRAGALGAPWAQEQHERVGAGARTGGPAIAGVVRSSRMVQSTAGPPAQAVLQLQTNAERLASSARSSASFFCTSCRCAWAMSRTSTQSRSGCCTRPTSSRTCSMVNVAGGHELGEEPLRPDVAGAHGQPPFAHADAAPGRLEHPHPAAGSAGRLRRQTSTPATAAMATLPAASGSQDSVYALRAPTPPANKPEPMPRAAMPLMMGAAQQATHAAPAPRTSFQGFMCQ